MKYALRNKILWNEVYMKDKSYLLVTSKSWMKLKWVSLIGSDVRRWYWKRKPFTIEI